MIGEDKICYKCRWFYIDGVDGEFCCNIESMYFNEGWGIDSINIQGCNMFHEGEPFDDNKSLEYDTDEERKRKCKILDEAVQYYRNNY